MPFENNIIIDNTIEDAWRSAIWCCVRNGRDYVVEGGSYIGQIRRQLPYVVIDIQQPWTRPLAPRMPEGCGIPPTTTDEKIIDYFVNYIFGTEKSENEDYTYGQFINPQVNQCIRILNESNGNSNQSCITIGDGNSISLQSPPCLKVITFKVIEGKLQMSVVFRSWDLYAGFPENLGGLQILKEYVLSQLEFEVEDGNLVAYSDGLHLYEQYFGLVNVLSIDKIYNKGGI